MELSVLLVFEEPQCSRDGLQRQHDLTDGVEWDRNSLAVVRPLPGFGACRRPARTARSVIGVGLFDEVPSEARRRPLAYRIETTPGDCRP
jgi:hypothetical protein